MAALAPVRVECPICRQPLEVELRAYCTPRGRVAVMRLVVLSGPAVDHVRAHSN